MRSAQAPVFVEAIKNRAGKEIISLPQSGGQSAEIIAQIKLPQAPAPDFIGLKSHGVVREPNLAVVNVIADQRLQGEPGARLDYQIRINIRERALVLPR